MAVQTDVTQRMLTLDLVSARCTALFVGFVIFLLKIYTSTNIPVEKIQLKIVLFKS